MLIYTHMTIKFPHDLMPPPKKRRLHGKQVEVALVAAQRVKETGELFLVGSCAWEHVTACCMHLDLITSSFCC